MLHRYGRLVEPYVDGELNARLRSRFEAHVRDCADCTLEIASIRRRRLRAEQIVEAGLMPVTPAAGMPTVTMRPDAENHADGSAPPASRRWRWILTTAATLCVLLAAVLLTAWSLGGARPPAGAVPTHDWESEGTALTSLEVAQLRAQGWNLPTLRTLGYSSPNATGYVSDGQPRVELTFPSEAGMRPALVIVERRLSDDTVGADPLAAAPDGAAYSMASVSVRQEDNPPTSNAARLGGGNTRVETPFAVYTVTVPAGTELRDSVVNRIVLTEYSQLHHAAESPDGPLSRIMRGLSLMSGLELAD